jgi:hypothetical protein
MRLQTGAHFCRGRVLRISCLWLFLKEVMLRSSMSRGPAAHPGFHWADDPSGPGQVEMVESRIFCLLRWRIAIVWSAPPWQLESQTDNKTPQRSASERPRVASVSGTRGTSTPSAGLRRTWHGVSRDGQGVMRRGITTICWMCLKKHDTVSRLSLWHQDADKVRVKWRR